MKPDHVQAEKDARAWAARETDDAEQNMAAAYLERNADYQRLRAEVARLQGRIDGFFQTSAALACGESSDP